MTLTPYETYKESGIDWLGAVPEHWEVKRIKDTIQKIGSGVTPKGGSEVYVETGVPFLRSQNVHDEGLRIDNVSFITNETNDSMKNSQIRPKDIVLNITGASIGRTCVVPDSLPKANISQHILYLRFRADRVAFITLYLKSYFIKQYTLSIQAGASKEALTMGQTLNFPLPIPPLAEQTAIANYLDQQTVAIDRKTALLHQKIATYQALRKSIINETVCRGLNKTAPLKDSGIEWIGQIPAHWEVRKLKELASLRFSNVDKNTREDHRQVLLCNYVDVYKNDFITGELNFMLSTASEAETKRFSLRKGDVMITKDSETHNDIAVPALVKQDLDNVVCGYHLALIRSKDKEMNSAYVFYLFRSGAFNHGFAIQAKGITRVGLSINSIADALLLLPPLAEQTAIAAYLDQKTATIDAIVRNLNAQLTTLAEFRKTLINEVVTGRVRVINEQPSPE